MCSTGVTSIRWSGAGDWDPACWVVSETLAAACCASTLMCDFRAVKSEGASVTAAAVHGGRPDPLLPLHEMRVLLKCVRPRVTLLRSTSPFWICRRQQWLCMRNVMRTCGTGTCSRYIFPSVKPSSAQTINFWNVFSCTGHEVDRSCTMEACVSSLSCT